MFGHYAQVLAVALVAPGVRHPRRTDRRLTLHEVPLLSPCACPESAAHDLMALLLGRVEVLGDGEARGGARPRRVRARRWSARRFRGRLPVLREAELPRRLRGVPWCVLLSLLLMLPRGEPTCTLLRPPPGSRRHDSSGDERPLTEHRGEPKRGKPRGRHPGSFLWLPPRWPLRKRRRRSMPARCCSSPRGRRSRRR